MNTKKELLKYYAMYSVMLKKIKDKPHCKELSGTIARYMASMMSEFVKFNEALKAIDHNILSAHVVLDEHQMNDFLNGIKKDKSLYDEAVDRALKAKV